jgi:hypothetical protein
MDGDATVILHEGICLFLGVAVVRGGHPGGEQVCTRRGEADGYLWCGTYAMTSFYYSRNYLINFNLHLQQVSCRSAYILYVRCAEPEPGVNQEISEET